MPHAIITGKTKNLEHQDIFHRVQKILSSLDYTSTTIHNDAPVPCDFDVVFCIGGDGNFAGTVRKFVHFEKPIIGINAGTLGFLPNVSPHNLETQIPAILKSKQHMWTRRLLITGKASSGQKIHALNEFLFSNNRRGTLSQFTISINSHHVMNVRADGLLIATPTGSTAYNLSAGGPVTMPDMELLIITPVCPHILGARPIVVGLNNHIEIINHNYLDCTIWADGQDSIPFKSKEVFTLTKPLFAYTNPLSSSDFFQSLAQKLGSSSALFK